MKICVSHSCIFSYYSFFILLVDIALLNKIIPPCLTFIQNYHLIFIELLRLYASSIKFHHDILKQTVKKILSQPQLNYNAT